MNHLGIINKENTAFVLIDLQEKFVPVIYDIDCITKNIDVLVKASRILGLPLIATEQYPKGLGHTINKIEIDKIIEKISFSCFDNNEFKNKLRNLKAKILVLFGIEAHVCVLKTALDGIKNNFEVHVVSDAISSRTLENKKIAIERMKQSGVFIASTEMILFQLVKEAGSNEFKEISRLIK